MRRVRTEPGGRAARLELRCETEPEAALLLEGPALASELKAIGIGGVGLPLCTPSRLNAGGGRAAALCASGALPSPAGEGSLRLGLLLYAK